MLVLLGVPRRTTPDGPIFLTPGLATQLAAVLAIRGDWLGRGELVALLWPDADGARGRRNLSQLLYSIRRTAWGHDVETEARRVRWSVRSDVADFRLAVSTGIWTRAAELYAGGLLEGTSESASPLLDDWLRGEREDLLASWRHALLSHAAAHAEAGRWHESARLLRRLLVTDGLLEEAVRALMRCEAHIGHRDAALQVYDAFRTRLDDELALEPIEATTALAAAVRRGELDPPDSAAPVPDGADAIDAAAHPPAPGGASRSDELRRTT